MFDAELYLDSVFRQCIRGSSNDLSAEQAYAVEWLYENPYSALFASPGFGKTVVILTLLNKLFDEGLRGKILIDAPIKVCNTVWPLEIKRWTHTAWMSSTILRVEDDDPKLIDERQKMTAQLHPNLLHMGDRKEAAKIKVSLVKQHITALKEKLRIKLLKSKSLIHVCNHEMTDWLVDYYLTRKKPWPYRTLIWDESSRLRDHQSNVFTAIQAVRPYMDRVHELTATPAKQSYVYFFSQIYVLDQGERFGRGITNFRDRYFTENRWSRKLTLRPGAAQEIEKKIADIVLPLKLKQEYTIRIRSIYLPSKVVEKYTNFEANSVLDAGDTIINAVNAGVLNGKLLQLATGAVYDNDRDVHFFHESKFDELEELLEETQDEPVMCAYWFKPTLARLKKRFPKAQVMDTAGKNVAKWQKKPPKLMLVHPQSTAHGVDGLQNFCHTLAVIDLFHSAELFEQLIGRIARRGQTEPVTVHLFSARRTVDNIVGDSLQRLEDAQDAMYRRLMKIHKRLKR